MSVLEQVFSSSLSGGEFSSARIRSLRAGEGRSWWEGHPIVSVDVESTWSPSRGCHRSRGSWRSVGMLLFESFRRGKGRELIRPDVKISDLFLNF